MTLIRHELRNGIIVLICFLVIVAATDYFIPTQLNIFEYSYIDADYLASHPTEFEGQFVSSEVIITEVNYTAQDSEYFAKTQEGLILLVPSLFGSILIGDKVDFRGISYILSVGYLEVIEIHVVDQIGPIFRSVPGILAFVILFFIIFKIDIRGLAFVPRRESNA